MVEAAKNDDTWETVASFCRPCQPEPAFEELVAAETARWRETAVEAGLAPDAHVRVGHDEDEVFVAISPTLSASFNPVQTLWKAE